MDSRITKKRLQVTLSYDWVKLIAFAVGVVFIWLMAYTVGAPRASTGQTFDLFVYRDFACAKNPETLLDEMKDEGVFSYDILKLSSRELDAETYATIISTVVYASEGDAMIISNYADHIEKNESKMRDFIDGYGDIVFDYERMLTKSKEYCIINGFVYLDGEGKYQINESNISSYFANRMQKDPRFRNKDSEKYKQGERDEIERIKRIWNNTQMLEYCLQTHPELAVKYRRFSQNVAKYPENAENNSRYEKETEKIWAINLGALTGGQSKITDLYARSISDENGDLTQITADGIVVCLFDYETQPDHAYEGLQVINHLIKKYSNFLDDLSLVPNLIV